MRSTAAFGNMDKGDGKQVVKYTSAKDVYPSRRIQYYYKIYRSIDQGLNSFSRLIV